MIGKILRLFVVLTSLPALTYARQNQNAARPEINVLHVQGNVYMLVGAVGNITVQVASDGILMVDTGSAQMTDQVLAGSQGVREGLAAAARDCQRMLDDSLKAR